jgi:hypothetical protein
MVLFRDDDQLPSIGNSGATNIPQLKKNGGTKGLHDMTQCQEKLKFLNLAEEAMGLDQICRKTEDQVIFKGILERLHLGWMNEQDEARLRVLTLDDDHLHQRRSKTFWMVPYTYSLDIRQKMHTTNKNCVKQ